MLAVGAGPSGRSMRAFDQSGRAYLRLLYPIVREFNARIHQHLPTHITTPAQIQMPALMAVRKGARAALVLAA